MKIGDIVRYDLTASHGGEVETAICCGTMAYGDDVVLLATESAIGMPINEGHCRVIIGRDVFAGGRYRNRYLQRFPAALKPLPREFTDVEWYAIASANAHFEQARNEAEGGKLQ